MYLRWIYFAKTQISSANERHARGDIFFRLWQHAII
ncbi:hypothetical protein T227_12305 [Pseudomonas aeruginosa LESlike5]|nr:hypothetical protein T223_11985 [Pseudomonas aeruginosa LES431]AHK86859.1 hypothetical protein T227_12305 [Pseudomonas aeruginosa LESlike5]AHK92733.1 hypothetical protein T228_11990 [Pseudomonas aeruginosa LESlike7]AHK98737.1 hypothetical protein T222_12315 [Pseudomonas aeruginosa LES400]AHL04701.1 hypothetical protein T224_12295 [Pseudomonas aeruginosa LESB65]AHL10627.1 hypothetical protein T225_12310 [Pseudomonas aeruginosa LESlike1]AHL16578.1 hypothetical protein T226_12250 [Pseudomonas